MYGTLVIDGQEQRSKQFGDSSFAFAQSVTFWRRGWNAPRAREREGLVRQLKRMRVSLEGVLEGLCRVGVQVHVAFIGVQYWLEPSRGCDVR